MVTVEQNQDFMKQPTKYEVKKAMFRLNGVSARGPDGFTGKCFHCCWDIIGYDVYNMVFSRVIDERLAPLLLNLISDEQAVLRKMGFCERFIGVAFGIMSNNWYSMLINGQPYGFFKSIRGVKQGDPLSPTLFILDAEALSRGLNALHLNLYFCGFGLPKWSPKINHLAYTDDTIIFSSSDATSLQLIMEVLSAYEVASR
ncbi:uncharacterized protein LOC142167241 [Nicotiana tabacum]|uniref:Uncharacterized protein LOC142167241 n=1 Tax=Nicotiana tabacum TaxID=4097 RepID=A0AC58SEV8_TOBAC